MKVKKNIVRVFKTKSDTVDHPSRSCMSPSDALSFVWELTEEVYSLSGKYDVKSRLQRHIVTVIKK